jgi:hypothetical protein
MAGCHCVLIIKWRQTLFSFIGSDPDINVTHVFSATGCYSHSFPLVLHHRFDEHKLELIKITDKLALTQICVTHGFRFCNKVIKIRSIGL